MLNALILQIDSIWITISAGQFLLLLLANSGQMPKGRVSPHSCCSDSFHDFPADPSGEQQVSEALVTSLVVARTLPPLLQDILRLQWSVILEAKSFPSLERKQKERSEETEILIFGSGAPHWCWVTKHPHYWFSLPHHTPNIDCFVPTITVSNKFLLPHSSTCYSE